jgi:malonyl-CoA decarboxylase
MASRYLGQLWHSVADRGREILSRRRDAREVRSIGNLCRELISERGEASGVALAREVVEHFQGMDEGQRLAFFELLDEEFSPHAEEIAGAASAYLDRRDAEALRELSRAVESPRQELIRRINLAPNGTAAIVAMRAELLRLLRRHARLAEVDRDFRHVLRSWFNRGFLELRLVDWNTPAALLEKLIEHEAVHEIRGWPDMRRRLEEDRRCFAFFHPALPDEPLIFVEVALLDGLADSIESLLALEDGRHEAARADTAIFYSINNCQDGLRGISFGSFLIKQVVFDLVQEQPRLKAFATLSPVPGFRGWLDGVIKTGESGLEPEELESLSILGRSGWHRDAGSSEALKEPLLRLCARYLLEEKEGREPLDRVARFHLGNGARVERLNWLADPSKKGLRQSAGIMVNYAYLPSRIERNHEAYVRSGRIAASAAVRAMARRK